MKLIRAVHLAIKNIKDVPGHSHAFIEHNQTYLFSPKYSKYISKFTIDFIRVHEFIKYLNIIDYIDGGHTIYLCGTLCTLGMGLG